MKILVTGAAGFIGSNLVTKMLELNFEVIGLDNLSSGYKSNLPTDFRLLEIDVTNDNLFSILPNDISHIVHLASHVGQEISFEEPARDLEINLIGTAKLLEWAERNSKPKFVFASSMSIYGDPKNPNIACKEDELVQLNSPYSLGKYSAEKLFEIFESKGIQSCVLRLFNVYGTKQDLSNLKQGMVSIYASYIARDLPIVVKGSLERFRDFIHVDDVIAAILLCLKVDATGTYNVCSGNPTILKDLIDEMLSAFGKPAGTYPIEIWDSTPGDQFGIYGDNSKLRSLGWRVETSLSSGLQKMSSWVELNRP